MTGSRSTAGFTHARVPHFVAIGRLCYDQRETDRILGGSCAYSAILARNLGYVSAIATSVGDDFPPDALPPEIRSAIQIGKETTTFANRSTPQGRVQFVHSVSAPIRMTTIPERWLDAAIVYLCPILDDFDPSLVNALRSRLVGVAPQGWMRRIGQNGRITKRRFEALQEVVPEADLVILSEEDVCPEDLPELVRLAQAMVLTHGKRGAELFWGRGQHREHIPAFVQAEVDETGAGDVFGAAFLLKYYETLDLHEASYFASWMASFVVQGEGTQAIPGKAQARLWEETAIERPLKDTAPLTPSRDHPHVS